VLPSRADIPSSVVYNPLTCSGPYHNSDLTAFTNLYGNFLETFKALSLLAGAPGVKVWLTERSEI